MNLSAIHILRRVPLFSGLAESDLAAFAALVRERRYPKGAVIVFRDDPGDALYVVADGQVKVVLVAEDGREVILSVLRDGDFFGEMSVLDDEPRSAHVIAMEDSRLLALRRADEQIGRLVLLDVNGRVASLLLTMAAEEGGDKITRRLTHHTIAQMIGASRETVSRTLRNLVEHGVIEVSRKEILLRDRATLGQAARRV